MSELDKRVVINTDLAPTPIGPYSQAIRAGNIIFLSGVLGLDPKTGAMAGGDVESQARQIMANAEQILAMAGSSFARVAKTTIFLMDLNDFQAVNKIYGGHFPFEPPARSTIQVAALPMGARVEIEFVAMVPRVDASEAASLERRF